MQIIHLAQQFYAIVPVSMDIDELEYIYLDMQITMNEMNYYDERCVIQI